MFIFMLLDDNSNKISSYFWLALITTVLYVFVYLASSFKLKVPPKFITSDKTPNLESLNITRNCLNVPQKCTTNNAGDDDENELYKCNCQSLCDSTLAYRYRLPEDNKFGLPKGVYCYNAPDENTHSCNLEHAYWVYIRNGDEPRSGSWQCVAKNITQNDVHGNSTEYFYPGAANPSSKTDEHNRQLVEVQDNLFTGARLLLKNTCYDGQIDLTNGKCICPHTDTPKELLQLYAGSDERCHLAYMTLTNNKTNNKHLKLNISPYSIDSPLTDTENRLIFKKDNDNSTAPVQLNSMFELL